METCGSYIQISDAYKRFCLFFPQCWYIFNFTELEWLSVYFVYCVFLMFQNSDCSWVWFSVFSFVSKVCSHMKFGKIRNTTNVEQSGG